VKDRQVKKAYDAARCAQKREARLAERLDRTCGNCREPISPLARADAKWCSGKCSTAVYHAAQRLRNPPKYGWVHCPRCGRMLGTDGQHKGCLPSFEELFWARVDASGDCWLWTGPRLPNGYGSTVSYQGKFQNPHRIAWRLLVGPIPSGLTLDHLCRNPPCVNPDHLEPVTPRENTLRGYGPGARNAVKTECPRGHPYDDANTYLHPHARRRGCRICLKAASANRAKKEVLRRPQF
jgi:HNH endonuclease